MTKKIHKCSPKYQNQAIFSENRVFLDQKWPFSVKLKFGKWKLRQYWNPNDLYFMTDKILHLSFFYFRIFVNIHESEMHFHENDSEIFDVILHYYFHNRPVWRYRSILWILMNVHGIQECPWKKNAKHVWWHNIFSGGQIHVIFGQNDFSWNLKFRKNLNFCQKLTSVGKAETLTAKIVCPNYNIPRFFSEIFKFCFQKSHFSSNIGTIIIGLNSWLIPQIFSKIAFLLKNFKFEMTFKIQYQKQRILTLNRPQIKLWKSNILFVILLILTIQKPSLGCVLGYISLSLPVFCGRDFHPTHFNGVKKTLIPVDLKCRFDCISKKSPKKECQGNFVSVSRCVYPGLYFSPRARERSRQPACDQLIS